MWEYLKQHEEFIKNTLQKNEEGYDWNSLREFHQLQIERMQHERLIHLLVTLAVGLYLIAAILTISIYPTLGVATLALLLIILLGPYIIHYFRLENGVQRWYLLANEIDHRCKRVTLS